MLEKITGLLGDEAAAGKLKPTVRYIKKFIPEGSQEIKDAMIAIATLNGYTGRMGIKDEYFKPRAAELTSAAEEGSRGNTGGFDFAETSMNAKIDVSSDGGFKASAQKATAYLANGKLTGFKLAIVALNY